VGGRFRIATKSKHFFYNILWQNILTIQTDLRMLGESRMNQGPLVCLARVGPEWLTWRLDLSIWDAHTPSNPRADTTTISVQPQLPIRLFLDQKSVSGFGAMRAIPPKAGQPPKTGAWISIERNNDSISKEEYEIMNFYIDKEKKSHKM